MFLNGLKEADMPSVPVEIIFGKKSGIPVAINTELRPLFDQIDGLAKGGNHWAKLCIQQLSSLTSSHFKKNVYMHVNGRLEVFGDYTVILPGCKASFRKNSEGIIHVYALEADLNFDESQKNKEKPGLFKVKKNNGEWKPEYIPDGKIRERKVNVVVVADQRERIATSDYLARKAIADTGRPSSDIDTNGYELHFTPGDQSIGGLRHLVQASNAETDSNLHESAVLLAKTMISARVIKDVTWISERGGSGVLTQAMRILKESGADFSSTGHRAFFSHIQTNLGNAETLARQLGLVFDSKTHKKDWWNVNESFGSGIFGGFVNPIKRAGCDEKYSKLNCIKDVGGAAAKWGGAIGIAVAVPTKISTFTAVAATLGSSLAVASGSGMMFAIAGGAYAAYKASNPNLQRYSCSSE
jgi:hypothetical protein